MAAKTSAQITKKWATNTVAAGQAMRDGINAVTDNPMQKAAAAADRLVAGVQRAVASGKFQQNTQSVSLATWKNRMLQKGVPRVADGVTAATSLVQAFHDQHQQVANDSSAAAAAAKAQGVSGKERMLMNFDKMSGFRFQRPTS